MNFCDECYGKKKSHACAFAWAWLLSVIGWSLAFYDINTLYLGIVEGSVVDADVNGGKNVLLWVSYFYS